MLAYAIAAVSPTMDIANAALPAYVTSLLFFVGLLLRIQDQPAYWKWCVTAPSCVSMDWSPCHLSMSFVVLRALLHVCLVPLRRQTLCGAISSELCQQVWLLGLPAVCVGRPDVQPVRGPDHSRPGPADGACLRAAAACVLRLLVALCATSKHDTEVEVAGMLQALQFYGLASENKWAQLGYESTFFALFFFLAWCAGCCSVSIRHSLCAGLDRLE